MTISFKIPLQPAIVQILPLKCWFVNDFLYVVYVDILINYVLSVLEESMCLVYLVN